VWWAVPELWSGRTIYILGGGPSLADFNWERLRGERVIAVNNSYMPGRAPWAPVLYFMDWGWYNIHKEALGRWSGLKITACDKCKDEPGVRVLKWRHRLGLDDDPRFMTRGTCAGFGATSVGAKLGGKGSRLILLGFDMQMVDGRHNYHSGEHKMTVDKAIYVNNFIAPFRSLVAPAKERGIEIINATPGSALPFFPIVHPDEVIPC